MLLCVEMNFIFFYLKSGDIETSPASEWKIQGGGCDFDSDTIISTRQVLSCCKMLVDWQANSDFLFQKLFLEM